MLEKRNDRVLLSCFYTTSSSMVGLLLLLQYYQRCAFMVSKIWGNVNLFCDHHAVITYWPKKVIKKSGFWSTPFWKTYFYCQSQEIIFNHHLKMIYFWVKRDDIPLYWVRQFTQIATSIYSLVNIINVLFISR